MAFKKHWFGYSIAWIGILHGSADPAEAVVPATEGGQVPGMHRQDKPFLAGEEVAIAISAAPEVYLPEKRVFQRIRAIAAADGSPLGKATTSLQQNRLPEAIAPPEVHLPDKMVTSSPKLTTTPLQARLAVISLPEQIASAPASEFTTNGFTPSSSEVIAELVPSSPALVPDVLPLPGESVQPSVPATASEIDPNLDPELGRLLLREQPVTAVEPDQDVVFLQGRMDYFRSDNILLGNFDPVDDQLFRLNGSLLAVPNLGPQTQLVAAVGGGIARYVDLADLDYNTLELRAGIRQELSPRTYGELGWSNFQFFDREGGDRFLNDHSLRLSFAHRERFSPKLTLDGFYQLRLSFTNPDDRSRVTNTLAAFLSYEITPRLGVGLDYSYTLTNFTQQEREDSYHQIAAQLSYRLSRNSSVSLYAGFSFGRSSDSTIDFDSTILGVVVNANLALF